MLPVVHQHLKQLLLTYFPSASTVQQIGVCLSARVSFSTSHCRLARYFVFVLISCSIPTSNVEEFQFSKRGGACIALDRPNHSTAEEICNGVLQFSITLVCNLWSWMLEAGLGNLPLTLILHGGSSCEKWSSRRENEKSINIPQVRGVNSASFD